MWLVLVLLVCGGCAALVISSLVAPKMEYIQIEGHIKTTTPITIYFVGIPDAAVTKLYTGDIHAKVPKLDNVHYEAQYVVGDKVIDQESLTVQDNRASIGKYDVIIPAPEKIDSQ
jgi:hypothetical protein